jgi:transposase
MRPELGSQRRSPDRGPPRRLTYSPDFNPIENAFSKLKALMRKAAARTRDALWAAVGAALNAFTPDECRNYFTAAGYEPN